VVGWLYVLISSVSDFLRIQLICEIVLFRAIIILFVTVGVVLIVDTCCTSVLSVVPVCTSPQFVGPTSLLYRFVPVPDLWAQQFYA
jgi:hypothetical protein